MRVGPFQINRARAAAAEPTLRTRAEIGASGTINQHGFLVSDEYNRDLQWPTSLDTWVRMLDGDASAREAYMHVAAPVLNANWGVEPAGNTPEDLAAAELVRCAYMEWLGEDSVDGDGFPHLMQLTMKYLAQGFQLFERVDRLVENRSLVYTDPSSRDDVTVPARNWLVWDRWAHRKPRTMWKWNVDNGRLVDVQQYAWKDETFGLWTIPAGQLSLFVNEKEGDDFRGMSLFRSAYKAWYLKELVEKVAGISVERHGVGVNVGYLPEDAKNDQAIMDRVELMLQDLQAGERPYMVFPGPKQKTGAHSGVADPGYLFEIVTPGTLPDFTPLLEYLRGEIKGAVLARFSELGHGSTGARATGDTQSEPWYDSLHAVADYVADVHRPAIRQLVQRNMPRLDRFPSLVARDIESRSLTEYADAVSKLALANLILPDKAAREAARQSADMPDEDDNDPAVKNANQPPPDPARLLEDDPTGDPTTVD